MVTSMTQGFEKSLEVATVESGIGPEVILRRPVMPVPSSQAQHSLQSEHQIPKHDSPKPTNRDRYENKPMPDLPSEASNLMVSPPRKPYIQPAIPLVHPATAQAKRAITDPLGTSNHSMGRKPSVSHLRKVFGHVKRPSRDETQMTPSVPHTTRKAAIILGLPQHSDHNRHADFIESTSSDGTSTQSSTSEIQVPSEVLTTSAGHHRRTDSEATVAPRSMVSPELPTISVDKSEDRSRGLEELPPPARPEITSSLSPKIANYGQVGGKTMLHDQKLFRVESVQGIIEHAESPNHISTSPDTASSNFNLVADEHRSHEELGLANEANHYKGVWESDPAVGYSLPPFSPNRIIAQDPTQPGKFATRYPETSPSVYMEDTARQVLQPQMSERSSTISQPFSASTPLFQQGSASISNFMHTNRDLFLDHHLPSLTELRPQLGSANSWAQSKSTQEPPSALLPPRWPRHSTNSVPPPPLNQHEYQRSDSIMAGISQLDRTIHHHLDTAVNSLSRLITERNDKILDHILRNLDDIGDLIAKNHKTIKNDLKNINNGIHKLQAASTGTAVNTQSSQDHFTLLQNSMTRIEKGLDDQKQQVRDLLHSSDERQPRSLPYRRAESAHGYLPDGTGGRRLAHDSLETNGSNTRTSKTSVRSHRSNTSNSGGLDSKGSSKAISGLKTTYAPPDIKQHPAFADTSHPTQTMVDQNGKPLLSAMTYGTKGLVEHGWYQQAYGSG